MGVFSYGGVGFDLGSGNVTIHLENEGIVLREPSFVLLSGEGEGDVVAVGREARQMVGRTPREVELVQPVQCGAIADVERATQMIQAFCERAIGRKRALERSRVCVTMPMGLTTVERRALESAVKVSGAKKTCIVMSGIAAVVGAGIQVNEPKGVLSVNIGAETTEIAVITMNGVAAARSLRTGGRAFDEAIMRYVRREKGLIIGRRTAEDLKIDIGSAVESRLADTYEVLLRGRDAANGKPSTVSVSANDVRKAISCPVEDILESVREAFENTPPELAADIIERGVQLSGGGAQLEGLDRRLSEMLNLPVKADAEPQDDVAAGLGAIASDEKLCTRLMQSGCVVEL